MSDRARSYEEAEAEEEARLCADYRRRYPIDVSEDGAVWWFVGEEPTVCAHDVPFTAPCRRCGMNADRDRRAGFVEV